MVGLPLVDLRGAVRYVCIGIHKEATGVPLLRQGVDFHILVSWLVF